MPNDCVWLAASVSRLNRGLSISCDLLENDKDTFLDVLVRFERGQHVNKEELPRTFWAKGAKASRKKKLPHLFSSGGFLTVSQQMKETLEPFNLGASWFAPVDLLHADRKRPYPGQFFYFFVPEWKLAFAPDASTGYEPKLFDFQTHTGTIELGVKDNEIAVDPSAGEGVDVWYDDSLLWSFFFRDRVYQAINEKGLTTGLEIVRCPILTGH